MTTRNSGPGGRVPNQGKPVSAPGVGRNSKRHDLERAKTPGLHGSDLQQGDVQALEQGQRIAPITEQGAGVPQEARQGAPQRSEKQLDQFGQMPSMEEIITERLAGTMGQVPNNPDAAPSRKRQAWLNVMSQVARQPGASPLLRSRMQTVLRDAARQGPKPPQGGTIRLTGVDEALGRLPNDL